MKYFVSLTLKASWGQGSEGITWFFLLSITPCSFLGESEFWVCPKIQLHGARRSFHKEEAEVYKKEESPRFIRRVCLICIHNLCRTTSLLIEVAHPRTRSRVYCEEEEQRLKCELNIRSNCPTAKSSLHMLRFICHLRTQDVFAPFHKADEAVFRKLMRLLD